MMATCTTLELMVLRLFELLDSVEESESGNLFRPTTIGSCRTMHCMELNTLLPAMRDWVGLQPHPPTLKELRAADESAD